jgi:O-acetyl-ADP-ribose deacetylase (regulator of RNase III)
MAHVTAVTDDLTTMDVDVVVNAANEQLQHGGGVAAALSRGGGPTVQQESDAWVAEHGPVGVGQAATTTAGRLPASHIVHVVGPRFHDRPEDPDHLAAAVIAALDAALAVDAHSVALPAISAGIFGYPLEDATSVIAVTASTWARTRPDEDLVIRLVGLGDEVTAAFRAGLDHDPLAGWPSSAPTARDRPRLPDGYGLPDDDTGLQDWTTAESKLAHADTVWLATTRPDGRPHVVPRWGVWLDNQFFYDGAPTTVHVRNLAANDRTALHLESGTDVVIVNGVSGPTTPPSTWLAVQLVAAYHHKYGAQGYTPGLDAWSDEIAGGLCRFVPHDAMAWASFPTDATRWTF